MSGHTPGPWFAGRALRGGQECIIGDGDSVVCFMPDRTIGCTFVRDDALLIAASPMLLAFAELLVSTYHEEGVINIEWFAHEADRVIAAATGEPK